MAAALKKTALVSSIAIVYCTATYCSAQQTTYCEKSYVDSLIQTAFYAFNASIQKSGEEYTYAQAISYAKQVVSKLTHLAKHDYNKQYILFKVRELNNHIYLEEEELVEKSNARRLMKINALVNLFNKETKNEYPDFHTLFAIHENMEILDPQKAQELAELIHDRSRQVVHTIVHALEQSDNYGDTIRINKQSAYLQRNRKYLPITPSWYDSLKKDIENKINIHRKINTILSLINKTHEHIIELHLKNARRMIQHCSSLLQQISMHLNTSFCIDIDNSISNLKTALYHKEDSLVNENLKLIQKGNTEEAIDYYEDVVRNSGVSRNKLSIIDSAILFTSVPPEALRDTPAESSIAPLAQIPSEPLLTFNFDHIKIRAAMAIDSLRNIAHQEKPAGQTPHAANRSNHSSPESKTALLLQKNRDKAQGYIIKLYSLIAEGQIENAYNRFLSIRAPLKKYSPRQTFTKLEMTLLEAYASLKDRHINKTSLFQKNSINSVDIY